MAAISGRLSMRFRTVAVAAALATGLVATSNAFVPHKGGDLPFVAAGRAPRAHRTSAWTAPKSAHVTPALASWSAIWDRDTDVPLRMWGKSIATPGVLADATAAEAAARSFLAANLATLAPGATMSDFVVVANQLDGHIRTVGFAQQSHGLRVLGGGLGVMFERDHLVMVTSTALPNVSVQLPVGPLRANAAAASATHWLQQDGVTVDVRGETGRVIVPVVHQRGAKATADIDYRVAETVRVKAQRGADAWDVWVDATDAAPIARHTLVSYASGVLSFDVPDRYPGGGRSAHPASNVTSSINGVQTTSDFDGNVTWAGTGTATVTPGLSGPLVAITNVAGGVVQEQLSLAPAGTLTWSKATDSNSDAQLDAYVFASQAKHFAQTRLNPNADAVTWLNGQIPVFVNENDTCNAYSNGDDIHFFIADNQCENTGRIADVVYHEFGHSLHANSIIQGVGQFDSSLSEGLADTLAVSITGDHGMGRGFFFDGQALRDVDPVGTEKRWPDDADGEPHDEGEIIGEALYDLRKALESKLGTGPGFEQFLVLYYGVMQRASDIPSSYPAALLADDDNGDLSDGTPNQCDITAAFGLHGLSDPIAALGLKPPTRDGFTVSLKVNTPSSAGACPPPSVASATLTWKVRGGTAADLTLASSDGETYSAVIPTQPDGSVLEYHVALALSDGSMVKYPDNPADPDYQMYVGTAQSIKCFDFESGFGDWTHAANPVDREDWEAGTPLGLGGDPNAAHGGTGVIGTDLGLSATGNGIYRSRTKEWTISPEIDLAGNTANVHVQYWRWLNVEDGAYDNAIIYANATEVWSNFATPGSMPTTEVNHTDKEWRFQDVDVSAAAASGKLTLKFELDSDAGLSMGGWNIDDVCVVIEKNVALCGNGTVDTGESCDDGNNVDGDGCSASCAVEACPDSGGTGPCEGGGGCCSSSKDPSGPILLSALVIGGLVIRRRRRR
jgi:MYXO-CTERM domain-containing protein